MSRSTRLFEVIQILRTSQKPLTAHQIAEALEVSARTVYRDIVSLQAMRVPIEGEAGVGYLMRRGYDLPPLSFSSEELEAVAVGMTMLARTGDKSLHRAAQNVVRKIAQVQSPDDQLGLTELSVFASVCHEMPAVSVDLQVLRQAVREEEKLKLDYEDRNGESTRRTVMPVAVFYYVEAVVLAAWCELRQGFRHFRADRIAACEPTGERFTADGMALRQRWRQLQHIH